MSAPPGDAGVDHDGGVRADLADELGQESEGGRGVVEPAARRGWAGCDATADAAIEQALAGDVPLGTPFDDDPPGLITERMTSRSS